MTTELIGAGVTVFIDPLTDMLREHGLSLQARGRSPGIAAGALLRFPRRKVDCPRSQ